MSNKTSQIDTISAELVKLSVDVTSSDRKAAASELGITLPTITRYLQGDVRDIDTGLSLLKKLKQCVSDRDKELRSILK